MNLQPSLSIYLNEQRSLISDELDLGGHGQKYLNGAGTYTPSPNYIFYKVDFLSDSTVNSVNFRNTNYDVTDTDYTGVVFPKGFSWIAPIESIELDSGTAVIYQYKKFIPEDIICGEPALPNPEVGYEYAYLDDLLLAYLDDGIPLQILSI